MKLFCHIEYLRGFCYTAFRLNIFKLTYGLRTKPSVGTPKTAVFTQVPLILKLFTEV